MRHPLHLISKTSGYFTEILCQVYSKSCEVNLLLVETAQILNWSFFQKQQTSPKFLCSEYVELIKSQSIFEPFLIYSNECV
jgi:hypothetical protein